MKNSNKKRFVQGIIYFAIIASICVCLCAGCKVNPAAERTCKILWEEKALVFLENENLTINERELWIINILQSLNYTDTEIVTELNKIRQTYDWKQKPQSRPQLE